MKQILLMIAVVALGGALPEEGLNGFLFQRCLAGIFKNITDYLSGARLIQFLLSGKGKVRKLTTGTDVFEEQRANLRWPSIAPLTPLSYTSPS